MLHHQNNTENGVFRPHFIMYQHVLQIHTFKKEIPFKTPLGRTEVYIFY